MSATPFMPLWVSDFLGDTLDLDAAEIGAYMLLLMAQWNRSGRSLPNDPEKLKRVARCGRNWPKVWASIERFFSVDDEGVYSQRLRLEAQNVAAKREVNARNGSLGGRAKALKSKGADLANAKNSPQRKSAIPEPEPYKEDTNVSLLDFPKPASDEDLGIDAYNSIAERLKWPKVQSRSKSRERAMRGRLKDAGGLDGWSVALEKAEKSDFLSGRATGSTPATFDWLTKPANFTKLMEGNYDNRTDNNGGSRGPTGRGSGTVEAFAQVARNIAASAGRGDPDAL